MDDLGQNPVILPPQVIEKPTSVTVFGVLNIVFGGLAFLCTPVSILGIMMGDKLVLNEPPIEIAAGYKGLLLVSSIVGIGFAAWLLSLGIGLLKMKRWARRGSVIYAWITIVWSIIGFGLNILALSVGWITPAEGGMAGYVGGMCGGMVSLIYPVLLLIFMQTAKVKQAFAAISG